LIPLKKNKTLIIFLIKFFATYFVLFGIYSFYLHRTQQKEDIFSCSPLTREVAVHVEKVANLLGYHASVEQHTDELSMKLSINGKYVSRIIEGCNSISIIILFLAFIIAFSGPVKSTILFGIFGSVLIYLVNILRFIGLSVMYYRFPEYQKVLHDLVYPAVIYGLVFVLWITWVTFYSNIRKDEFKKTI
jgi:exosortase family protein XrtF